jgi:two-component system, cell cycle response regulator DivK
MALFEPGQHIAHFYERDEQLCLTLAEFVVEGLRRGERIVLLATSAHWAAVRELLVWSDIDLERAIRKKQIAFVDAERILADVSVNGRVDRARYRSLLGATLEHVAVPFRVFFDVMSLLVARGQLDSALEIEEVGHELAHASHASVLCAYNLEHVEPSSDAAQRLSRCHDRTIAQAMTAAPEGPLVLLADDFEDARELYRAYFESKGYRMVTAADGVEALAQAQHEQPSVVVLDVRMPRMTGIEVVQALKRDPRFSGVPLIALTAHALEAERAAFLAEGFDVVVSKPCMPEDLLQLVERLLPGHRSNERR